MSCKSAIYCVLKNFSAQPNGQIPFGSVVRRFGRNIDVEGMGMTCCGDGYYDVQVVAELTPATAGTVGIQLYEDGRPVDGALMTATADANSPVPIPLTSMVRQRCGGAKSLSMMLVTEDGVTTATTVNMSSRVEKQ